MRQPDYSIIFEDVSHAYTDRLALHPLSIQIAPGQVVGLIGPNGAGKSTIMKIITGYMTPSSGKVEVVGLNLSTDPRRVREKVGYLPEHVALYERMLVHDYLDYMAKMRGVSRAQRASLLQDVARQTGLSAHLGAMIHTLSKGYRQRVGLAQAIIHRPELLVLDEPTTGLDPNQILDVREIICHIGASRTVLFSTHIMQEVAAVCDRVLLLDQGRLLMDELTDSLRERAGNTPLATFLEAEFHALTHHTREEE